VFRLEEPDEGLHRSDNVGYRRERYGLAILENTVFRYELIIHSLRIFGITSIIIYYKRIAKLKREQSAMLNQYQSSVVREVLARTCQVRICYTISAVSSLPRRLATALSRGAIQHLVLSLPRQLARPRQLF
jgi:hypothetical protein